MEEQIKKLKKNGFFDHIEIDEKGYGTFLKNKPNDLEQAHVLKKEGDLQIKINKEKGIKLYIDAMFKYIKDYKKLDEFCQIGNFQALYIYVLDIYQLADENINVKQFLKLSLFSIKMYICNLKSNNETSELSKNVKELNQIFVNNDMFISIFHLERYYIDKYR